VTRARAIGLAIQFEAIVHLSPAALVLVERLLDGHHAAGSDLVTFGLYGVELLAGIVLSYAPRFRIPAAVLWLAAATATAGWAIATQHDDLAFDVRHAFTALFLPVATLLALRRRGPVAERDRADVAGLVLVSISVLAWRSLDQLAFGRWSNNSWELAGMFIATGGMFVAAGFGLRAGLSVGEKLGGWVKAMIVLTVAFALFALYDQGFSGLALLSLGVDIAAFVAPVLLIRGYAGPAQPRPPRAFAAPALAWTALATAGTSGARALWSIAWLALPSSQPPERAALLADPKRIIALELLGVLAAIAVALGVARGRREFARSAALAGTIALGLQLLLGFGHDSHGMFGEVPIGELAAFGWLLWALGPPPPPGPEEIGAVFT
jgi:hypothetical protein